MNIKSFLAVVASTVGILTLSSPASAVIYSWQFQNENGENIGNSTDIVSGFVEFDAPSFADLANLENVGEEQLQITSITGVNSSDPPFFNDGGLELNTNINFGASRGTFNFDSSGNIILADWFLGVRENRFYRT